MIFEDITSDFIAQNIISRLNKSKIKLMILTNLEEVLMNKYDK